MEVKIQTLIIQIIGAIAVLTLLEVFLIQVRVPNFDQTLLNTMIMIPGNAISILGGFLGGRALAKMEQENNTEIIEGEPVAENENEC